MAPQDPIFSSLASDADMIELVQEFVTNLRERMAALRSAFEAHNLTQIAQLAHQLKGAGGGYGFDVISLAAAELETASKGAESVDQVRQQMDELIVLCGRASASPPPA